MHSGTSAKLTHPVNQGLSAATAANYNAYVGSGLTGASGFDTIVPFQTDNTTDFATLKTAAINNVVGTGAQAPRQAGLCVFPATGRMPRL